MLQAPPHIENGGGENSFLGRTRCENNSVHGPLLLLRYEAKQSMALKELDKVFVPGICVPALVLVFALIVNI